MTRVEFMVYGTPTPQGSTRAFIPKGWKRAVITTDNKKLKPWRQEMVNTMMLTAKLDADGNPILSFRKETPIEVTMNFYFTRPKSAAKRLGMTVKPDLDKLARAVFDALKGVVIHDDAHVIELHCRKHYGGPERVEIRVEEAIV